MASAEAVTARLSPFLLPTSTTTLFLLLTSLTAGAGATGYTESFIDQAAGERSCMAAARAASPAAAMSASADFLRCTTALAQLHGASVLLVASAILVVLVLVHRCTRGLEIRRHGLQPLERGRFPLIDAIIDDVLAEAGIRRRPQFLIEPLMTALWGRAFGSTRRPAVTVTIGLVRARSPGELITARALIRHELAHVANRDLDVAGLSRISLLVFVAAVAVPIVVITGVRNPGDVVPIVWRLAAVAFAIGLIRAALLRSREHDADVRASVWAEANGDAPFLASAFVDRHLGTTGRGFQRRALRLAHPRSRGRLLDSHPGCTRRAEVVTDPALLLRAGIGESAGAGLAIGLLVTYFFIAMSDVVGNSFVGLYLLGLALGFLLMLTTGTGLWRATLAALTCGGPLPSGVPQGLALAAGLVVGDLLSPAYRGTAGVALSWVTDPGSTVVAVALVTALAVVSCRWVVGAAAVMAPAARGGSLVPMLRAGQVLGIGIAAATITTATIAVGFVPSASPFALAEAMIGPLAEPVSVVAVLAAPAAVVGFALRRASGRDRMLLLGRPDLLRFAQPVVRPGVVLGAVMIVGALAVVARVTVTGELLARFVTTSSHLDAASRFASQQQALYTLLLADVAIAIMIFATTTVVAAPRTGGLIAPAHGVIATFFGCSVAMLVDFAEPALQRCHTEGTCQVSLISQIGAILTANAIIAVWVAILLSPLVALTGLARRRVRPRFDLAAPNRKSRRYTIQRISFLILLCATFVPLGYFGTANGLVPGGELAQAPPIDVANAPPAGRPGQVPITVACASTYVAQTNPFSIESAAVTQLHHAQDLEESNDRALQLFGSVMDRNTRSGEDQAARVGRDAADAYCNLLKKQS